MRSRKTTSKDIFFYIFLFIIAFMLGINIAYRNNDLVKIIPDSLTIDSSSIIKMDTIINKGDSLFKEKGLYNKDTSKQNNVKVRR